MATGRKEADLCLYWSWLLGPCCWCSDVRRRARAGNDVVPVVHGGGGGPKLNVIYDGPYMDDLERQTKRLS
jgi:hypothetical protein